MRLDGRGRAVPAVIASAVPNRLSLDPRTQLLLEAPITPMLLRLAWPNIAVMLAMASTGLIETWWVARLGLDALAGVALVFPGFTMMQMLSAGAMGGGISSAVARALGGGRRDDANALVLHAIVVNVAIGSLFAALVLGFGPSLYRGLGGEDGSLAAALVYSNIVFAGTPLVWLTNALANVIRGTGNMLVPAVVMSGGVAVLVPLSPCLIFGIGPFPALGIAGAGIAVVSTNAFMAAVLALYLASGRSLVHFTWARPQARLFGEILRVGAVASVTTLQTTLTVALATGMVGAQGGPGAVAGYGTGNRLEYLMIPLVFGFGAPLVALVGTNLGAGRRERALRIAFTGAALAFALTETVGLLAALSPESWLGLFSNDREMHDVGAQYLRIVGPAYGFFGMGLALYFASQGAGRLLWPLLAGLIRLVVAVGAGWIALAATGSLAWLFAALAFALIAYGLTIAGAVARGAWFRPRRAIR